MGPAQPRGVGWNGAGGWLIFSQCRQVNFSRTVWITFHVRGITSSVSVMSSPIFDSLSEPQHGQVSGGGTTTRSRGRCAGKRFAFWLAAVEPFDLSGLLRSLLGCKVILGRRRFEFAELELKLVQKALLALRFDAIEFALKLLDRQLQVGDMRLGVRHLRLGCRCRRCLDSKPCLSFGLGFDRLGCHRLGYSHLRLRCCEGRPQGGYGDVIVHLLGSESHHGIHRQGNLVQFSVC